MEYLTTSLSEVVKGAEEDLVWNFMNIVKTLPTINTFDYVQEEKPRLHPNNWKLFNHIEETVDLDNNNEEDALRLIRDMRQIGKLVLLVYSGLRLIRPHQNTIFCTS